MKLVMKQMDKPFKKAMERCLRFFVLCALTGSSCVVDPYSLLPSGRFVVWLWDLVTVKEASSNKGRVDSC